MDAEFERRKNLTFLQAEGVVPLPTQMALKTINRAIRVAFSHTLSRIMGGSNGVLTPNARLILSAFFQKYPNEINDYYWQHEAEMIEYIDKSPDVYVLNLMEFVSRLKNSSGVVYEINKILKENLCAYRLEGVPPTLMPVISPEQAESFSKDFAQLQTARHRGATTHLSSAAEALSKGDFMGSVRESIHAVESAAKVATGDDKATLSDALKHFKKTKKMHPAMAAALEKLYGWTNDAQGIRHALIEPNDDVTEGLALFMFSACAAFAAWISKEITF